MPKPIHLPHEALSAPGRSLNLDVPRPETVVQALGQTGLPGLDNPSRLDSDRAETSRLIYCSESFSNLAHSTRDEMQGLFSTLLPESGRSIAELDDPAFAGINWEHLESGYEAYQQLMLEPALVISPEGCPMDFWRRLYANLYDHFNDGVTPSKSPLGSVIGNKGLLLELTKDNWNKLVPEEIQWTAAVIPAAAEKPPYCGFDHQGKGVLGSEWKWINEIAVILAGHPDKVPEDFNPSIEQYLFLQATRLFRLESPLDLDGQNGVNYKTWLYGTYPGHIEQPTAAIGGWESTNHVVKVSACIAGSQQELVGMRPAVRG